jgi:hypothetical protein
MSRPPRTVIALGVAVLVTVVLGSTLYRARTTTPAAEATLPEDQARPLVFFDDFGHTDQDALEAGGWTVRTAAGAPGIRGASWGGVSFVGTGDARVLRLTATTDGTPGGTTQAEVCHAPKVRNGTSAARVRFSEVAGSDVALEAFAARGARQGAEGEFAFEYRSGAGVRELDVARPDGKRRTFPGGPGGWHVLVAQVDDRAIAYFVDGERIATPRGAGSGPASALGFGVWFEQVRAGGTRTVVEDVDWIFHQANVALHPRDVLPAVASLRRIGIGFEDTLPRPAADAAAPCRP